MSRTDPTVPLAMVGATETVVIQRLVAGGDGLGRLADGRVVFVPGTLPEESVVIQIESARRDHVRGVVVELLSASPDRVQPPCQRVAAGCGGCDWQHVAVDRQLTYKTAVVADALNRIARAPELASLLREGGRVGGADGAGWRTTVRAAVNRSGRAGFYKGGTHDVCASGACMVAHPVIGATLDRGTFTGVDEVLLRVGTVDNCLVVGAEDPQAVRLPSPPAGWQGSVVALSGRRPGVERAGADLGVVEETICGHTFRVSIGSFFQSGPEAATLLVETIRTLIGDRPTPDAFVDLYGGVGLFSAILGHGAKHVLVVESSDSAVDDARFNLASNGLPEAVVHRSLVEEWTPPRQVRRAERTWVIADPARAGLDDRGVAAVLACNPELVVLVSCDPAAGARDIRALVAAGFQCVDLVTLDLFPHTSHVELVSCFVRYPVDGVAQ
jgi:23S rRNA (uracil1939-C5)-methyltransferase